MTLQEGMRFRARLGAACRYADTLDGTRHGLESEYAAAVAVESGAGAVHVQKLRNEMENCRREIVENTTRIVNLLALQKAWVLECETRAHTLETMIREDPAQAEEMEQDYYDRLVSRH
jgi:hypothetical protein